MKRTQIVFNDHQDTLDQVNGYHRDALQANPHHTLIQFLAIAVPIAIVIVTFTLMYLRISTVLEVCSYETY